MALTKARLLKHDFPVHGKPWKIQSNEKVTKKWLSGSTRKQRKTNYKVTKKWQKQGKSCFLVTFSLLFRYFRVDPESHFFITFSLLWIFRGFGLCGTFCPSQVLLANRSLERSYCSVKLTLMKSMFLRVKSPSWKAASDVPKPGCFKPGCLQLLCRSALLRPFALLCALLRPFALFCALLRLHSFCALLRAFACFCDRPRSERLRLATADRTVFSVASRRLSLLHPHFFLWKCPITVRRQAQKKLEPLKPIEL